MRTVGGGSLSALWSVAFEVAILKMEPFHKEIQIQSNCIICPQDLVSAKRRVSIFDKLRNNIKAVRRILTKI